MKREIKFRVYDKRLRFMYPDAFDHPDYDIEDILGMADFEVMQYIGLLDKQGREIYEGDIVALTNPKSHMQKKRLSGVVIFSHGSFGIEIKSADIWEGYSEGVEPPNLLWFLNVVDFSTVEVIGNVWDNEGGR